MGQVAGLELKAAVCPPAKHALLPLPVQPLPHSDPTQKTKHTRPCGFSPSCAAPHRLSADLMWEAFRKGFLCIGRAAARTLGALPP